MGWLLKCPYPELLTTWYAERLIDGSIPASKENIQAAKRHMRDFQRQGTDDFPWIFDEEKVTGLLDISKNVNQLKATLVRLFATLAAFHNWIHVRMGTS